MVTKEHKLKTLCCFYVSDFHLEMILVPYINEKLKNNEDIIIQTEKDLTQTIEILVTKMNLKDEEKLKILKLGWQKGEKELKQNSNIIIIGKQNYIEKINSKIKNNNIDCKDIVDCYEFEEIKEKINEIICRYNKNLNTLGYNKK